VGEAASGSLMPPLPPRLHSPGFRGLLLWWYSKSASVSRLAASMHALSLLCANGRCRGRERQSVDREAEMAGRRVGGGGACAVANGMGRCRARKVSGRQWSPPSHFITAFLLVCSSLLLSVLFNTVWNCLPVAAHVLPSSSRRQQVRLAGCGVAGRWKCGSAKGRSGECGAVLAQLLLPPPPACPKKAQVGAERLLA